MSESINLSALMICIIAVDSKPRNSELLDQVAMKFPNSKINVIRAVIPSEIDSNILKELVILNSNLYGRKIGELEVAVNFSHRKCIKKFNDSDSKLLLVLEDDVVISDYISLDRKLLNQLESKEPVIVSLYSPYWSVWKKTKIGLRAKFPPAFAAAYFMNKSTASLACNFGFLGLADWPPWALSVKFYLESNSHISCLENNSYLEITRKLDKNVIFKKTFFKPSKYGIRKKWQFIFQLYIPIIWKFYKIINIFDNSINKNKRVESCF